MHGRRFWYSLLIVFLGAATSLPSRAQQPKPVQRAPIPEGAKEFLLKESGQDGRKGVQRSLRHVHTRKSSGRKLQTTQANIVTRSGTSLPNVDFGSHSTADLNGDGHLDLLITGWDGNTEIAEVYFGDGQGGFTKANAGITGVSGSSTSIADVNGDGNQDLLVVGQTDSGPSTTVYLGDGKGGFTEANAGLTDVGWGSSSSIADVDGDGNLDVLIAGMDASENPTTALYLGDGQGGFAQANAGLKNVELSASSISDVNGDGNRDLVIVGDTDSGPSATLYLGDGQGGFTEANAGLSAPGGLTGAGTSIADVNGDGNPDLLIGSTLYVGNGDATFTEANAGLTTVYGGSNSIGDVDGDGNLDLLIAGDTGTFEWTATLYLGDGRGGFTEADAGLTGAEYGSISIADVEGDGDQDILVSGSGPFGISTRLYVNRTVQTAPNRAPRWSRTVPDMPLAAGTKITSSFRARAGLVEVGDPDGDRLTVELSSAPPNASLTDAGNGVAQVSFSPNRNQIGKSLSFSLTASDPSGLETTESFTIKVPETFAAYSTSLTGITNWEASTSIADVNRDGDLDILVAGENASNDATATLYLGDGQGSFNEANAGLAGIWRGSTSIADVDGDGNQDVLIVGSTASGAQATLYLGDGQGGFRKANAGLTGIYGAGSTSIADVDGDGNPDLLITGFSEESGASATLYLGNGGGSFTEANAGFTGVDHGGTAIGDVDGDGNLDILITGADANGNPTAKLYLGNGQGGFSEANAGLNGVYNGSTSIADINGDGNLDLLITSQSEGATNVYLGNGQGGFTEANAGLPDIPLNPSVAEVDGDGHLDLLLGPNLYLGDDQGGFTWTETGIVGTGATSMGDLNGDGNKDLVVAGKDASGPSVWVYENLKGRAAFAVDAQRSYESTSSPADYELVGLPGQIHRPVAQTLNGSAGQEWKAFWDDGSDDDYLAPVGDSTGFRSGVGYWLLSKQSWTVQDDVTPVPLSKRGTYPVEVHDGWNIISNPFAHDLDWVAVQRLNDTQQPLWRFDSGYSRATTFASARSGEAFYFYNDTGRDVIELPYAAASDKAAGKGTAALRLRATTEDGQQASIEVGYAPNAKRSLDRYDQPAPPDRFSTLGLQLSGPSQSSNTKVAENSGARSGRWAGLYRSTPSDGGSTYDVDLRTKKERPVEIDVTDKGLLESRKAVLVDQTTGEKYRLHSGEAVTIQPDAEETKLRLLVGSDQYVRQKQEQMTPTELRLLPNAPNPVRKQTTLRYSLPETKEVEVVVYDVLGRKVQTLVDGRRDAGLHEVRWQVPDLSSGLYVARLTASGQSRMQKLVVVK